MTVEPRGFEDLGAAMRALGQAARAAQRVLAQAPRDQKDEALKAAAATLRAQTPRILAANEKDMAAAREAGQSEAFLDRLALDEARVEAMAKGLEAVAELPDPVGRVLAEWERPNGLVISRLAVPLGVIGIVYESRPNVTADAGALCLKAGNAAILRGGSDSFQSAGAILDALQAGLRAAGLPESCVQRVPTTDRAAVGHLLTMTESVDVIVPRGGRSLIERVQSESRVPVLAHLEGVNHTYVQASAELEMAVSVVLNAKMRRTGVCGATETLLIDRAALSSHLPSLVEALLAAGCELRGDAEAVAFDSRIQPAGEADWDTEYLAPILSIRVVADVTEAVDHIARHGSGHTEAILTGEEAAARRFVGAVDAAIVMVNASTQFADGGEFGMGAEIGISTGRLHARGPVGTEQLTTMKYLVRGTGQTRP